MFYLDKGGTFYGMFLPHMGRTLWGSDSPLVSRNKWNALIGVGIPILSILTLLFVIDSWRVNYFRTRLVLVVIFSWFL